MKRQFFLLFITLFLVGCATSSVSSGLWLEKDKRNLPEGVPKKVIVLPFGGDSDISLQAADQFSAGLSRIGFDVVDRNIWIAMIASQKGISDDPDSESSESQGTGFLLSKSGLVVTNNHVIEGRSDFTVLLPQGSAFKAKVVLKDEKNDIAFIKLESFEYEKNYSSDIPYGLVDSKTVKIGEDVLTLGYPLGDILGKSVKLSTGKVNALYGLQDDPRLFQISNPIQPGNSGGPLINSNGELVGIVVASLNAKYFYETIEVIPQNVNFSIKSDYLLNLVSMLPEASEIVQRKSLLGAKKIEEQVEIISPYVLKIIANVSPGDVAIDEEKTKRLSSLGIEGIFAGSVTGESSPLWVDTHLNITFTDLKQRKILWSVSAHDPRTFGWSMDIKSSIVFTVRQALKLFEKDLFKSK